MDLRRFVAMLLLVLLTADLGFAAGSIYSVSLAYETGRIYLVELHVAEGFADAGSDNGPYECRLISAGEKVIKGLRFAIPNEICYDEVDTQTGSFRGGCTTLNRTEFRLFIPYEPSAKTMEFYDKNNELILSADLSKYSEKAQSIASKVGVQGSESNKGIEDASVQKENIIPEDTHQSADVNYIYLALFLLAFAAVGFFAYRRLKR